MAIVLSMTVFVIGAGAQDKTTKKQAMSCCPGCRVSTARVSEAAAEPNAQSTRSPAEWMCTCPWCTMASSLKDAQTKGVNTENNMMCRDMMKKIDMSDAMMMRCGMMMRANISKNGPAGILALKEKLNLTEEQVNTLETIAETSRKQAEIVLTKEQKEKLATIAEIPDSMMEMYQWMMPKMYKMMKKEGDWTCPWIQAPSENNALQTKNSEQITYPIMGGPINKDIHTEYKGKKVYFCCPECKGKFEANPEKRI
jgi:YHS domain-containing protein